MHGALRSARRVVRTSLRMPLALAGLLRSRVGVGRSRTTVSRTSRAWIHSRLARRNIFVSTRDAGGLVLPIRYLTSNGRNCERFHASIARRAFTFLLAECRPPAINDSAVGDVQLAHLERRENDADRLRNRVLSRDTKLRTMDRLLTAEEIAERLGMRTDWVWAQARAGRIPHVRLGRYRRFRESAIEAWLKDLQTGGATSFRAAPATRAPTRRPV